MKLHRSLLLMGAMLSTAIASFAASAYEVVASAVDTLFRTVTEFFRPDAKTSLELDTIAHDVAIADAGRQRLPFLAFIERIRNHPLFSRGFHFDPGWNAA